MCKINFLEDKYIRENYRDDIEFGLCDDETSEFAYSNSDDEGN